MKSLTFSRRAAFFGALYGNARGRAADRPLAVSMLKLLTSPENFDGKRVTVAGFLSLFRSKHDLAQTALFLHRDDAENQLPNGVEIDATREMWRDQGTLNRKYVVLTGTFHLVPTPITPALGGGFSVIRDISHCTLWSDPEHPRIADW